MTNTCNVTRLCSELMELPTLPGGGASGLCISITANRAFVCERWENDYDSSYKRVVADVAAPFINRACVSARGRPR
jgi:peroxiredoxin